MEALEEAQKEALERAQNEALAALEGLEAMEASFWSVPRTRPWRPCEGWRPWRRPRQRLCRGP